MGAAGLLGACSNLIGLSDYQVDSSLDGSAGSPSTSNGGEPSTGNGNAGEPSTAGAGEAGQPAGGAPNTGGASPAGGEGGAGTEQTPCKSSLDCDDTIDCTEDACGKDGKCTHALNDKACDGARCEVCAAGIGCVAGKKDEMQLLLDASFDDMSGEWSQKSATFNNKNIFVNALAQSPTMIAKFGPAAKNATEAEYADLLQIVTIPDGTVALTLKGYYKVAPGTLHKNDDDYVVTGLWDIGGASIMPFAQFHAFNAQDGAEPAWKAFSYSLTDKQAKLVAGNDYTFDLVANAWDSTYQFDTLELNATVCQ